MVRSIARSSGTLVEPDGSSGTSPSTTGLALEPGRVWTSAFERRPVSGRLAGAHSTRVHRPVGQGGARRPGASHRRVNRRQLLGRRDRRDWQCEGTAGSGPRLSRDDRLRRARTRRVAVAAVLTDLRRSASGRLRNSKRMPADVSAGRPPRAVVVSRGNDFLSRSSSRLALEPWSAEGAARSSRRQAPPHDRRRAAPASRQSLPGPADPTDPRWPGARPTNGRRSTVSFSSGARSSFSHVLIASLRFEDN